MTRKQREFIAFYKETGDKTEAARRAGYQKPEQMGQTAFKKLRLFLAEPDREAGVIAEREEVLQVLTNIMRGDESEGESKSGKASLQPKDRIKAAELLGKRYGLFSDKGGPQLPLPVVITGSDELEE